METATLERPVLHNAREINEEGQRTGRFVYVGLAGKNIVRVSQNDDASWKVEKHAASKAATEAIATRDFSKLPEAGWKVEEDGLLNFREEVRSVVNKIS